MGVVSRYRFARRAQALPESFLSELFRLSIDPEIISFAGGLPDADLIDKEGIANATAAVLEEEGEVALQYSSTDGYYPLREYIATRYNRLYGMDVSPAHIQILNGSQQALDLVGKIFIDPHDVVGIESPGYLGAIEAFSFYEPQFCSAAQTPEGIDTAAFEELVTTLRPKFFYGVPFSQNPTGISYSHEVKQHIAEICSDSETLFYEDHAFFELHFHGEYPRPVGSYLPDETIISGSFSKTIAPGLRTGWIIAPPEILKPFNSAKQAADLHSGFLSQMILARYLNTYDYDAHLAMVRKVYQNRCHMLCDLIDDQLPSGCVRTDPKGGMFLWITLPDGVQGTDLFHAAVKQKVGIMPGLPFYYDKAAPESNRGIRLNFSSIHDDMIHTGIERLKVAFSQVS
ncbi:MAG: PLP-dependent aminotransferase family protein [Methanomicrobiales archaeon]|jgi:2-aminoadipate transaminase|nr:PLP-dependent aminotransferase family protein [Methanomicrobiales archaeon]